MIIYRLSCAILSEDRSKLIITYYITFIYMAKPFENRCLKTSKNK